MFSDNVVYTINLNVLKSSHSLNSFVIESKPNNEFPK